MVAQPPSAGCKPLATGGSSTARALSAASGFGATRGSFTAREPGVKLGLKLPAHSGEFSDAEQTRKESILKASEGECTAIASTGLYVGGEMVARNLSLLRSRKITHVLNMAGVTIPNFLEGEGFHYLTLYMHDGGDTAGEDFRSALPRILEWLDGALNPPTSARILVHVRPVLKPSSPWLQAIADILLCRQCQAGVSRSCSAVVAYLMWARSLPYDKALALVKRHRAVASPNMAFQAALLRWEQLRLGKLAPALPQPISAAMAVESAQIWLYRICRHHESKGQAIFVAKQVVPGPPVGRGEEDADAAEERSGLDPRGCFILRVAGAKLYGWIGKEVAASDPCRAELQRALTCMRRFECPADEDITTPVPAKKPKAGRQNNLLPKMGPDGGETGVDAKNAEEEPDSVALLPDTPTAQMSPDELVLEQGAEPAEVARLIAESAGGPPCHRKQFDASYREVADETPATLVAKAEIVAESPSLLPTAKDEQIAPLTARGHPTVRSDPSLLDTQDKGAKDSGGSVQQTVTQTACKPHFDARIADDNGTKLIPTPKPTKPTAPIARPKASVPTAAPSAAKTIVPSTTPRHQTPRINPETADPNQLAAMLSMTTPRMQEETAIAGGISVTGDTNNSTTQGDGKGGTALYHQVVRPEEGSESTKHGTWERFDNYDEDDLWPERLFMICIEGAPSWCVPRSLPLTTVCTIAM